MIKGYWDELIEESEKQRKNRTFRIVLIRVLIILAIMLLVVGVQIKKDKQILDDPCKETLSINNCYILSTEPLYVKN